MVRWCFLPSFSAGSIPVEAAAGEGCPSVQVRYGRLGRKREVKGLRKSGPGQDAAFACVQSAATSGRDALEIQSSSE